MEDFNLVLRDLISKDIENINKDIPANLKKEFETTAEKYIEKDFLLEAIKTFVITRNEQKLIDLGELCISRQRPTLALKAFYYAKNKEGLSKTGMEFIKQGEIDKALEAYKLADDKAMVEFITKNF